MSDPASTWRKYQIAAVILIGALVLVIMQATKPQYEPSPFANQPAPSATGKNENLYIAPSLVEPSLTRCSNDELPRPSTGLRPEEAQIVEDLMYRYGTDKSKDDHAYTNFYKMAFGPIRHCIRNVTEIGVNSGQSLQAWYRYFPNAEIHGFDIESAPQVRANLAKLKPRVHLHITDMLVPGFKASSLNFVEESMDLINEDGPHWAKFQEQFLEVMFRFVKPGGYYIVEDLQYSTYQKILKFQSKEAVDVMPYTRKVLEENDAFVVDTTPGHRAWADWMKGAFGAPDPSNTPMKRGWKADRHGSYLLVIRKRDTPIRPVDMHITKVAMNPNAIIEETGE